MNREFEQIHNILLKLKSQYAISCSSDDFDPNQPITERDIVSEIYFQLKLHFRKTRLSVHTEIKPAPSVASETKILRRLPKIDVAILSGKSWPKEAKKLQEKYKKGKIEARFSSVPVKFFHTAIEVKIQSNPRDSQKDIDTLFRIPQKNKSCNCFLVLLNARGKREDHLRIEGYAREMSIPLIEHTCTRRQNLNVFSE